MQSNYIANVCVSEALSGHWPVLFMFIIKVIRFTVYRIRTAHRRFFLENNTEQLIETNKSLWHQSYRLHR